MINVNMKARLTSKTWWISTISNLILVFGYFNIDLTNYIGKDWQGLLGVIFALLIQVGVTVDTSTKGLSDTAIAQATVQAINDATETKEEVKTESTTTAINNTVSQSSASSKITVDNPDNIKYIGQEVNAVNATSPSAN